MAQSPFQSWHGAASARGTAAVPAHDDRSVNFMPDSPRRAAATGISVTPLQGASRDWEGFMQHQVNAASYAAQASKAATAHQPPVVRRDGPPSVGVFANSVAFAEDKMKTAMQPKSILKKDSRESGTALTDSRLVNHQQFCAWKRKEYARRLEAETRGDNFEPRQPPWSDTFVRNINLGRDPASYLPANGMKPLDFEKRSRNAVRPQVIGSKEEIAWLQPPGIPPPVNWNGYWDLCPGHELFLQMMAVSGVTPTNSPSLVNHFMYPELLSCVQRLQYGTYLCHYTPGEPPHERYFYVKPLPLANKAQYCPFLCWSLHKTSHQAVDAIPLVNVMHVTQGIHTKTLEKYRLGEDYIQGPYVGKRRAECLAHGVFTVWFYDGKKTKAVDLMATDPLVFTMWMKVLEDAAQLNAALDTSGSVRALQRHLEDLREDGELDTVTESKKAKGFSSKYFGKDEDRF